MRIKELKFGLRMFCHPIFLTLLVIFFILPLLTDDYIKHVFIMIFFYAFLGLCWDICGGHAGLFSIGHAGFLGVGAYTSSYLLINVGLTPWIGMLGGVLIAVIFSLLLGYVTCRYGLIGVFFALTTIAFGECLRILVSNLMFLNGPQGMLIPFEGNSLVNFQFSTKTPYYYIMLGFLIIMMIVNSIMGKSKLGYYLIAIREDEQAADALGINLMKYKLMALALSASFTAIGGTFYAQYIMFIEPSSVFTIPMSVEIITRPIVGGMGTVLGPVVGSFLIGSISEITRVFFGGGGEAGLHLIIYGIIIIFVVIFMPSGVVNLMYRAVEKCISWKSSWKNGR